jgi:hypothetical protein
MSGAYYGIPPIGARLRIAAREEGSLRAGARLAGWGGRYLAGRVRPPAGTFTFAGRSYDYLAHPHNFTWMHERAVEVPIAAAELRADAAAGRGSETERRVLEVGHVLGHYGFAGHDVVDKYERAPGVRNVDVLELEAETPYAKIVSVSTLEHVGIDDEPRDPERAVDAIARLRALLAPGGRLFVTVPAGYNPALDAALREAPPFDEVRAMARDGAGMRWRECPPGEALEQPYDRLLYRARAVLLCTATA